MPVLLLLLTKSTYLMKKSILIFCLLTNFCLSAQTTIIDEKFEKDNAPLSYDFLYQKNKVVIEKGKHVGVSTNRLVNSLNSYDSKGNKEELIKNVELMNVEFSESGDVFTAVDYSKLSYKGQYYQYFVNNKAVSKIKTSEKDKYNREDIISYNYNDLYEIGLTNEKGKKEINFEKNDIYLELNEISTGKHQRIKLEKPAIERLTGANLIKPKEDLGFYVHIIDNDFFEIVTKSITKDYTTSTIYRTIYNFQGKKTDEYVYTVTLNKNFQIYSNSGITKLKDWKFDNNLQIFSNDLTINHFITDKQTGDVYVYGILGKKAKELNDYNEPAGFYVFKFDKTGKKIWESVNEINDKKEFNDKMHLIRITNSLRLVNDKLLFTVATNYYNEYVHYAYLDNATGNITKANKISFKEEKITTLMSGTRKFILSFFTNDNLKNKVFDYNGLICLDTNESFKKYIDSVDSKTKKYFRTMIAKDGSIWLLESDNETYYKLNYFN